MERQIGEKFLTPEGVELEVVLAERLCRGCYYYVEHSKIPDFKICKKPKNTGNCITYTNEGRIDLILIFKQTK